MTVGKPVTVQKRMIPVPLSGIDCFRTCQASAVEWRLDTPYWSSIRATSAVISASYFCWEAKAVFTLFKFNAFSKAPLYPFKLSDRRGQLSPFAFFLGEFGPNFSSMALCRGLYFSSACFSSSSKSSVSCIKMALKWYARKPASVSAVTAPTHSFYVWAPKGGWLPWSSEYSDVQLPEFSLLKLQIFLIHDFLLEYHLSVRRLVNGVEVLGVELVEDLSVWSQRDMTSPRRLSSLDSHCAPS